jgi:nitrite reductase/ring-hydroxylating ferredoxin subunit
MVISVGLQAMLFSMGRAQITSLVSFGTQQVDLNLPEYQRLRWDGGWMYMDELNGLKAGLRGLIVYRLNAETYIAYERACPYRTTDECARVEVDASNLFMKEPCCGSSFSFADGEPLGGPARYPLRIYETSVSGNTLTISDTIIR